MSEPIEDQSSARGRGARGAGPRKMSLRGAPITVGFILVICAIEAAASLADLTGWPPGSFVSEYCSQPIRLQAGFRDMLIVAFAPCFLGADLGSESYTLASSAFLHGSLLHVLINSALLAVLGPPIERAIGSVSFAAAILLLAIATPLGHWAWIAAEGYGGQSVLVGASGVVCGFIAIDVWARAEAIRRTPPELRVGGPSPITVILRVSAVMILVNAGIELLGAAVGGARISGAGHIGGYVAGLALAPFLVWTARRARRSDSWRR